MAPSMERDASHETMQPEENAVSDVTEETIDNESGQTEDAPGQEGFVSVSYTLCSRCGAENPETAFCCTGCRRLLVTAPDEEVILDEADRLFHLVQACEMVEAGEATLADFKVFIQDFLAEQQRREATIRTVDIPFGLEDEFAEEKSVGYQGVDMVNQALESLASYDPSIPEAHQFLAMNIRLFHDGVLKVREAMRINRGNISRPLWI